MSNIIHSNVNIQGEPQISAGNVKKGGEKKNSQYVCEKANLSPIFKVSPRQKLYHFIQ